MKFIFALSFLVAAAFAYDYPPIEIQRSMDVQIVIDGQVGGEGFIQTCIKCDKTYTRFEAGGETITGLYDGQRGTYEMDMGEGCEVEDVPSGMAEEASQFTFDYDAGEPKVFEADCISPFFAGKTCTVYETSETTDDLTFISQVYAVVDGDTAIIEGLQGFVEGGEPVLKTVLANYEVGLRDTSLFDPLC